ncbi:MAG TPA: hypothetical protein VE959_25830 [Bryobacteraceae bacterium]|nr:hypothetical protein [Bryobacteraceae bacterium]
MPREDTLPHPEFAPAHQRLAEIYGAKAFRDPEKERSEREKYLALCPGGAFTRRPPPLPAVTPLLEQAERLFAAGGEADRIIEMTNQGLMELEWRSQRIRAFDWYSPDYKRRDARDLRARYWQAWPLQVRCHRRAGRAQKAGELLASMEQNAVTLRKMSGPAYWDALYTLASLYAEGNQTAQANQKLSELRQLTLEDQDPAERKLRTRRIAELRKIIVEASR